MRPAGSRATSLAENLLLTAAAAGAAVLLAVLAAGGTYAFLNSSAAVAGATLRAGTATLAVAPGFALPGTVLHPGTAIRGSAVVSNTGQVPLQLRVSGLTPPATGSAFSNALTVGVGVATSAAACTAGNTPLWTGTLASASAADLTGVTLAPGASTTLCVTVGLPSSAPDAAKGASAAAFSLLVDGRQYR